MRGQFAIVRLGDFESFLCGQESVQAVHKQFVANDGALTVSQDWLVRYLTEIGISVLEIATTS